jgi:hypothetical protein
LECVPILLDFLYEGETQTRELTSLAYARAPLSYMFIGLNLFGSLARISLEVIDTLSEEKS